MMDDCIFCKIVKGGYKAHKNTKSVKRIKKKEK